MSVRTPKWERRSFEQIREHYLIEKELAARLRNSSKDDRKRLYAELYNELFRRVPLHPQLTAKKDKASRSQVADRQAGLLRRFLMPDSVFLEVGPGDCALAFKVAETVRKVYAVDVSEEISRAEERPANFELVISDGSAVPLKENSIDVAYSDQLMEHLHPEDAREQLGNIYKALKPGGVYVCITPNRLYGPADVSMYFDEVATGFHLKEYTYAELEGMFREAGFSGVRAIVGSNRFYVLPPTLPLRWFERVLGSLPEPLLKRISRCVYIRQFLRVKLVATK